MKRVLFIIPPYFSADDGRTHASAVPAFTIPYGILSLEAYVKKHCREVLEVKLLDLNIVLRELVDACELAEVFAHVVRQVVDEFAPDVVGFSALFTSSYTYLDDLTEVVRSAAPGSVVVVGGGLASAAFSSILSSCPAVDACCKGEGEIPLAALLDAEDSKKLLEQHPSWITREGLASGKVPEHRFVENLDDIPTLNYGLVNLDDYNARSLDKRYVGQPKREMTIHTSRGCPFSCSFCSNPSLHGKTVRTMALAKVRAEVRRMKEEFGMSVLLIEDDHFFHDQQRAKAILRDLVDLDVRIEFPNGVAVYAIDEEVAQLLAAAGVSTVALAVESGSDYVLRHLIRKPLKKALIKPAVELLRKYGILSHAFIVIGLPGELPEHRQESLEMLIDTGFDWVHVFCAVPIVGSALYDECVINGYIENAFNASAASFVNTKSVIRAPGIDPEEIAKQAYEMSLMANFVHNYNMVHGSEHIAEKYFRNVVEKYSEHAFAHYYLAQALRKMGRSEAEWLQHVERAKAICKTDSWWRAQFVKMEVEVNT